MSILTTIHMLLTDTYAGRIHIPVNTKQPHRQVNNKSSQ